MQAARCQNIYDINILPHTLHHVSDACKSVGVATTSKLLCTLKSDIAESDDLRIIDMFLNGTYVLLCYVSTPDNGKSFLVHSFPPHVLQTPVEIQKISLV